MKRIVHLSLNGGLRRPAVLALVTVFTVSACSSLALDGLAVVPGTPRPDGAATRSQRVAAPPRPTPQPSSPARASSDAAQRESGTGTERQKRGTERQERRSKKVTTIRLQPRPAPGRFRINLYRKGDFVHQATKDWCVAGSTQIMMNIIDTGKPDRSVRLQARLYERGRTLSPNKRKLGPIGVDLTGWAELLNTRGYGPYVVDGADRRRGAIRKAARALRLTNKPVGLVTWRGAHSWVMSGFTATADPAYTNDFKVKKVYVQDTWYPSVSSIWGASRPPDALVPVKALAEDYLPYQRPRARYPKRDGRFMLILPQLPPDTVVR